MSFLGSLLGYNKPAAPTVAPANQSTVLTRDNSSASTASNGSNGSFESLLVRAFTLVESTPGGSTTPEPITPGSTIVVRTASTASTASEVSIQSANGPWLGELFPQYGNGGKGKGPMVPASK